MKLAYRDQYESAMRALTRGLPAEARQRCIKVAQSLADATDPIDQQRRLESVADAGFHVCYEPWGFRVSVTRPFSQL